MSQYMRCLICLCLLMVAKISLSQEPIYSGFKEVTLAGNTHQQQLEIALWYPTNQQQTTQLIGDNAVFVGMPAIKNATIASGHYPLVVISHGFGGSWRNQVWLAYALSQQGYIVAAPNHPGTTTLNMNQTLAQNMLARPQDISRVITALMTPDTFLDNISIDKVAVIGHSYGGWTVIETIGGQFDSNQFQTDCLSHPELVSCDVFKQQMAGLPPDSPLFKLDQDVKDPRIQAAISLDLGFARGFTADSLSNINVPVLVISAGPFNDSLPAELESAYLAQQLPAPLTQYLQIEEATHFDFMSQCKPDAISLLKQEIPDESFVCEQMGNKRRQDIHQQLITVILNFLKHSLEKS